MYLCKYNQNKLQIQDIKPYNKAKAAKAQEHNIIKP